MGSVGHARGHGSPTPPPLPPLMLILDPPPPSPTGLRMETPGTVKPHPKADTPETIVVTDRVYYAGVTGRCFFVAEILVFLWIDGCGSGGEGGGSALQYA